VDSAKVIWNISRALAMMVEMETLLRRRRRRRHPSYVGKAHFLRKLMHSRPNHIPSLDQASRQSYHPSFQARYPSGVSIRHWKYVVGRMTGHMLLICMSKHTFPKMSTKDSSLAVVVVMKIVGAAAAVVVVLVAEITLVVTVEGNMTTMTRDHRHMI
jgi:hypothetical protein